VLLTPALFAGLSSLESSAGFGFECELPSVPGLDVHASTLVLDRLQDAGNVGTMLRSAAAFGCRQVLAIKGSVALWSPKVVRSGMGAHFGLQLIEGLSPTEVAALQVPILATSSHQGEYLHALASAGRLPHPCAWAMGHEGQGLSADLLALASSSVRIWQPFGQESLNVAVAASICLYTSATLWAK
jgi:TrmH family RNA methyltransferase